MSRRSVALWAVGLGILTGAITGSLVTTTRPTRTTQFLAGAVLVAVLALAVVIARRYEQWDGYHPFVRFVVYLVALLVTTVTLDGVAGLLVGGTGIVTQVVEVVAITAGFGVTLWVAFYGGADRLFVLALDVLDIEW